MSGLPDDVYGELDRLLAGADEALTAGWPGDPATRQPVQTLYLPADHPLVGADVVDRVGSAALESVEGEDAASMARHHRPRPDVVAAPGRACSPSSADQPVEDLRLDLEDGYGNRSDEDEDWDATRVGEVLAEIGGDARAAGPRHPRQVAGGADPPPRRAVARPGARRAGRHAAARLRRHAAQGDLGGPGRPRWSCSVSASSRRTGCPTGSLHFEVQVETPQSVLGADGTATVARAGARRRRPVHRPALRHLRLQRLPRRRPAPPGHGPPGRRPREGRAAGRGRADRRPGQRRVDQRAAGRGPRARRGGAGRCTPRLVGRSLQRGPLPGLGPAPGPAADPLPRHVRLLPGRPPDRRSLRLRDYLDRRAGGVLDEPATAYALAGFLARAVDCGAVDAARGRGGRRPRRPAEVCAGWPGAAALALDALPDSELRAALAQVCAAPRWVDLVAAARPFGGADALASRRRTTRSPRCPRATSTRRSPATRASASAPAARRRSASSPAYGRGDPGRAGRGSTGRTRNASATSTWSPRAAAAARSCSTCCGRGCSTTATPSAGSSAQELGTINRLRLDRLVEED